MRNQKGITLVALIITIIVLLVLAIVSINLVMNGGIIEKTERGTYSYLEAEIKEKVNLAYQEWKMDKESGGSLDLKEVVENELNKSYGEESVDVSKAGKGVQVKVTKSGKEYEYTLIPDGTTVNGQLAYLDIADGNIDLYSNGYKQYTGNLQNLDKNGATECNGKYIITGTTTENVVRVCDEGTFDITIKDLSIDVSNKKNVAAFLAGNRNTGLNVKINIEGNNKLITKNTSALSWSNVSEESGSALQLCGNGKLEISCGNDRAAMCIGGNNARNITINSGEIYAIRGWECYGTVIGGTNATITINGGNIMASSIKSDGLYGNNITINGGRIEAIGGEYGYAIKADEKLVINGGVIVTDNIKHGYQNTTILGKEIEILGGTIKADKRSRSNRAVINCKEGGNIKIRGGNILIIGVTGYGIGTFEGSTSVQYTPNDGTNNLYETQIKLQGVEKDKQITKLTTSDNINYGIKDMYTLDDGMLYLYLPSGTRTINVEVDGNKYSGTVETKETSEVVTLNKVN